MASLEEDIISALGASGGLLSLISNRAYPVKLPQNPVLPAVTYQIISAVPTYSHDGDSNLDFTRVQFTVWATTFSGLKSVEEQLRTTLRSLPGGRVSNKTDGYEPTTQTYQRTIDIIVPHAA